MSKKTLKISWDTPLKYASVKGTRVRRFLVSGFSHQTTSRSPKIKMSRNDFKFQFQIQNIYGIIYFSNWLSEESLWTWVVILPIFRTNNCLYRDNLSRLWITFILQWPLNLILWKITQPKGFISTPRVINPPRSRLPKK
jgi:hypothetical protein